MQIKITRPTRVAGAPAAVGEVVNVSEKDARLLITIGKAVAAESAPRRRGRRSVTDTAGDA